MQLTIWTTAVLAWLWLSAWTVDAEEIRCGPELAILLC